MPAPADRIAAVLYDLPAQLDTWHTANAPPLVRTYRFETAQPPDFNTQFTSWSPYSEAQKAAVRAALAEYSTVINVVFVESNDGSDPDISFGRAPMTTFNGQGYFQYSWGFSGGQLVKSLDGFVVFNTPVVLSSSPSLILHEIGHAMTLKHTGNTGAGDPLPYLPAGEDNNKYSVMSYIPNPDNGQFSDHLMLYDIAALQNRFGANLNYRTGDDVYTGPSGLIQTIWDAGGTDVISGAGYATSVTINLQEGAFSSLGHLNNLSIAYDVVIENAVGGTGSDQITGNAAANRLEGGGGSDVIYGLAGDDVLIGGGGGLSAPDYLFGGSGNDQYYVSSTLSSALDLVFEGGANADLMAGVGDIDAIHSLSQFFWDFYSVGETLYIDNVIVGGAYLVGGKDELSKAIFGSAGTDFISTYGHNAVVDAGLGTDAISFNLYGLDQSYRGANTVVMRPGSGADYVYDFLSGTDHIDLRQFNFGITGAQVLAQAVNVDNPGTANDYCYFYLTSAGGVDNFIVFIGLLGSQLQAGDFIT